MIKSKKEAIEGFRRDITRWQEELAALEKGGAEGVATVVRDWIRRMERHIQDLERSHA